MTVNIPFLRSTNNYRIKTQITNVVYLLDVRFNSFEQAWYLDMYEEDETPILMNIKLVLGARIGRTSDHPFFQTHLVSLVDTSGSGTDASFDDLGDRIQIRISDFIGDA